MEFKTTVPYADRPVSELSIYEKLNKARYIGRAAYYTHDSRAFVMNTDAVELIEGLPVGGVSRKIMKAYSDGWCDSADHEAWKVLQKDLTSVNLMP